MDMLQTILERRSIRKYTGESVPREQLMDLAKAGMSAPSSRDTRHFNFILVDDEEMIKKMAEGLPYAQFLLTAKHAIVVLSDLSVAYGGFEIDYWLQDSCAAAENILLAAKAMGMGTCWAGVHPREERVKYLQELLKIPENVRPVCVIAVGVPTGEEKPRDKFDETHVFWNQWGE